MSSCSPHPPVMYNFLKGKSIINLPVPGSSDGKNFENKNLWEQESSTHWNFFVCYSFRIKGHTVRKENCINKLFKNKSVMSFLPLVILPNGITGNKHWPVTNSKGLPWWLRKKEREVAQLRPTLCNSMDCSLLGSSVPGLGRSQELDTT